MYYACQAPFEKCGSRLVRILGIKNRHPPCGECLFLVAEEGFALACGRGGGGSDSPLGCHSLPPRSNPFLKRKIHPPNGRCIFWLPKKDSPSPAGEAEAALTAHRAVIHSRFVRILGIKSRHPPHGECLLWLPKKDSNPHKQSQSLSCYHYTIRQCGYYYTA